MLRLFYLIIFISTVKSSSAQKLEWVYSTEDSQEVMLVDMVIDTFGNVWQILETESSQIKIRKLDSNGQQLWSGTIGMCKVKSIDSDSQGNLFLLGSYKGYASQDLNPDPAVNNYFSANNAGSSGFNTAVFILKINNVGIFQFVKSIDGQGSNNIFYGYPQQLTIDTQDNLIIAIWAAWGGYIDIDPSSTFVNYPSMHTGCILKWNNSCTNLLFYKGIIIDGNPPIETNNGIDVTPKVIMFDIDSKNQLYVGYRQGDSLGVMKIGSTGLILENSGNYFINGFGVDYIDDIEVMSDNEILYAGNFISNIDVNVNGSTPNIINAQYPYSVGSSIYTQSFLVKYDSTFNVQWANSPAPCQKSTSISDIETLNGKIYICGLSDTSGQNPNYPYPYYSNVELNRNYLWIYNSDGTIYSFSHDISPYPYGLSSIFGSAGYNPSDLYFQTTNTNGRVAWGWGRRKLALKDGFIFIGGSFNARTTSSTGLSYVGGYINNFNWSRCGTITTYLSANQHLKDYLSKYSIVWNPPTATFDDTTLQVCLDSILTLNIIDSSEVGCDFEWKWYQNNCGGSPINSGNSYSTAVTGPLDIYVRAVGNGQVGPCTHISIETNDVPTFNIQNNTLLDGPFIVNCTNTTPNQSSYSFNWNWGDGSFETNNNVSVNHLYPVTPSVYSIQLSATQNGTFCVSSTSCNNCVTTGYTSLSEFDGSEIYLSPNPTSGLFEIFGQYENITISIYDLFGRILNIYDENKVDMSNYSNGVYLVKCHLNEEFTEFRVIKN
jgi:hypothetical protein